MSEKELQKAVIELAHRMGYAVAHFTPAQVRPGVFTTPVIADGSGFPDLVLVSYRRCLFIELKADGKYLNPKQKVWESRLLGAGEEHYVIKPKDWEAGRVEEILRPVRRPLIQ